MYASLNMFEVMKCSWHHMLSHAVTDFSQFRFHQVDRFLRLILVGFLLDALKGHERPSAKTGRVGEHLEMT